MKKNILTVLLALSLLTSCGSGDSTQPTGDTASENPDMGITEVDAPALETAEQTGFTVELDDGTTFIMGALADDTIASLGEAQSMTEAPSCVHEGVDRVYHYGSYTLTTSPDEQGNNRIQEIALISDAVALANGLSIGSGKSAVEAAFGSEYTEDFGVLRFSLEGAEVSVVLDADDCVSSLVILAK